MLITDCWFFSYRLLYRIVVDVFSFRHFFVLHPQTTLVVTVINCLWSSQPIMCVIIFLVGVWLMYGTIYHLILIFLPLLGLKLF